MSNSGKPQSKESVQSLDQKFKEIQHNSSVSISGAAQKKEGAKKLAPLSGVLNAPQADMDGLMDCMEGSALTTKQEEKKKSNATTTTSTKT